MKNTRTGPIDRGLTILVRRGFRSGAREGSKVWAVVGAAAWAIRYFRKTGGPKVVFSEELRPGETIVISHGDPAGVTVAKVPDA